MYVCCDEKRRSIAQQNNIIVRQPEVISGVKVANVSTVFSLQFNDHQMALMQDLNGFLKCTL